MIHSGMFVYPWDIEERFEDFTSLYHSTGCDSAAVALSYHHGSVLSPRGGRFYILENAGLHFDSDSGLYGKIKPVAGGEASGASAQIRDWCGKTGRKFTGWIVYLHNSTLGALHPDDCVKNAWGNTLAHALCPGSQNVVEYTQALTRDVIDRLHPDCIAAESLTPRTFLHGNHHEIMSVKMNAALEWLLSICFCDNCVKRARERGIDAVAVKRDVSHILTALSNGEFSIEGDGKSRIISILFAYPELFKYLEAYQQTVAQLIELNCGIAARAGVLMQVMPSATPYTIDNLYAESLNPALLKDKERHYLPLVYGREETFGKVKELMRLYDGTAAFSMCATLGAHRFETKGEFLSFIAECAKGKPEFLYYYNYSIATRERLSWVAEANELIK